MFTDQLDRAFVAIRNGSQDERLDLTTRVYLLELIELRAKQWHHSNPVDDYYSQKLMNIDNVRFFFDYSILEESSRQKWKNLTKFETKNAISIKIAKLF